MVATIRQHKGASAFYYLLPIQRGKIGGHLCLNSTETDFENVQVGSTIPMLVKAPISQMQPVRYADASGNFNPLHTGRQVAN
jgi:acyl dehydratase